MCREAKEAMKPTTRFVTNVSKRIRSCVHCSVHKLGRPGRQGKMLTWHPLRRFQVVAVDVLQVSTSSGNNCQKVAVIGDLFTRFVWACVVPDESAKELARVILDDWILRFGPPEKLLSDRAKSFLSKLVRNLCR